MKSKHPAWPVLGEDIHTIIFDFDGIFTDNKVYVDETGKESVQCDRADGLAIDMLRKYCQTRAVDLDMYVVSTERNPIVATRCNKLNLRCELGVRNKVAFVTEYLRKRRPADEEPFAGLMYFGNDLNDLQLIELARFSVAPDDAHPMVKAVATRVLPIKGGERFVRAAVEELLGIGSMTKEEIYELIFDRGNRH